MVDPSVTNLAQHEQRLQRAGYRLPACPAPGCGHPKLHVHGYKLRSLLAELGLHLPALTTFVAIFLCPKCRATWRVLPGFVARCLHRSWIVVERATAEREPTDEARLAVVPDRTRRRWLSRLMQSAVVPVQALATCGERSLRAVAHRLGLLATRAQLIDGFTATLVTACPMASLAELLHRLAPGIRLA